MPRKTDPLEAKAYAAAERLNAAGREFVEAHDEFARVRAQVDATVRGTPGADVRMDGPPALHSWEAHAKDLKRTMRQAPEVRPPVPRWTYMQTIRPQADEQVERMKLQRLHRRTPQQQKRLDELNKGRTSAFPTVTTLK